MKKKLLIIGGIVLAIVLLAISSFITPQQKEVLSNDPKVIMANAEKEAKEATDKNQKELINITVDEYLEMSKRDENLIFLLGKDDCKFCETAIPILQQLSKEYKLDIYYLNITKFTGDDQEKFLSTNNDFSHVGTPYLFVVNQEDVIDFNNGLTDKAHYKQFFKENGFIE